MSYEEMECINGLNAARRERACRRAWMKQMAIQWGGWLLAALLMAIQFATIAH